MTQQPIIIKKVKAGGHARHGGAWKVAYADFVTAMMAFFLLLWLLNAATREQLEGISDYFAPVSTRRETSGGDGFLAGRTMAEKGTFELDIDQDKPIASPSFEAPGPPATDDKAPAEDPAAEAAAKREDRQLLAAKDALQAAVGRLPEAAVLEQSLIIDDTPEGLRIQIVDQEGLPMFPRGEAGMYTHTHDLLEMVAKVIIEMPQTIAISAHTDATPFAASAGYTNWELSSDRANAVRRALTESGVPVSRIARVVGKAATEPLFRDKPEAPGNRRMAVVLLRGTGSPNGQSH